MKLQRLSSLAGALLVLAFLASHTPAFAQTDPATDTRTGYNQVDDHDGPDLGWLGLLGLLGLLGMKKRPAHTTDVRTGRPAHVTQ